MESFVHVPQQSRRDKLRVIFQSNQESSPTAFQPNPSSIFTNPISQTCISTNQVIRNQGLSLSLSSQPCGAVSRNMVPLGPFTGYASILNGSKFLKPAQELLDGFCGVDRGMLMINCPLESGVIVEDLSTYTHGGWKNSMLVVLLNQVYKRYKLYCQHMQSVVASFESVAGLGHAAPYMSFALKTMSKHFSCLKNAILHQIQLPEKTLTDYSSPVNDETTRLWTGHHDQGCQSQKPVANAAVLQHPVWRSQRGLPDHAVVMLKTWLFEHFLHPYPSDSEKQMLAQQTGLSRSQVSNWFINARVRLWKPLVEEVHMLETRQVQILPGANNQIAIQPTDHQSLANSLISQKLFRNIPTNNPRGVQLKRGRNELAEQMSFSDSKFSSNQDTGVRRSRTTEEIGVSLALGLHQSDGIELPRLPANMANHFNPETNYELYLTDALEEQNRHFGKNFLM